MALQNMQPAGASRRSFAALKPVVAILLLCCLLTRTVVHYGITRYFEQHRDYIAQNLCENRDKPAMKCNGQCYLRRQLSQVDGNTQRSKEQPRKAEKDGPLVYLLPAHPRLPQSPAEPAPGTPTPAAQRLHDGGIPFAVFHPPAVAA